MQLPRVFTLLTRGLAGTALLSFLAASPALIAQQPSQQPADSSHLVSSAQLQQQLQTSTATRQKNVENLTQFLSTPTAEKAMKDAKIDSAQVKTAIPTLSDADLANLSARAAHAQSQFAAGGLGTLAITLIILAIVLIILLAAYH